MTTLTVVDGYSPKEGRTKAVARRLRSELGALNIKGAQAARIVGVTQPWMSRRLNGAVAFGVDELDMICAKLNISFDYVATGIRALPGPDDGGGLSRLGESNPRPIHYKECPTMWQTLQNRQAKVLPFRRKTQAPISPITAAAA